MSTSKSNLPTELKEFDQRKSRAESLMRKFPDRAPLIIKKSTSSTSSILSNSSTLNETSKFLVPHTMTVSNVIQVLREKIKLAPAQSIYISVDNNIILAGSQTIGLIYNSHKAKDGFLYLVYCEESVFGGTK